MPGEKTVPCPHCDRFFVDQSAVTQHAKWKHGVRLHPRRRPRAEEDQSMADIAVEAHIKRLTGEDLDPLEESLLP